MVKLLWVSEHGSEIHVVPESVDDLTEKSETVDTTKAGRTVLDIFKTNKK